MLTQLHIRNIAVIHKAAIEFSGGFNVFTGETGAGKTILINAIDAVLGERTSREIIRSGEEKAVVSALFEDISPKAAEALEDQGYPVEDDSVLIVREITSAGKNTCKINGMPATVSVLREISSLLINIHGQRDSLQLLAPERHLELIDLYAAHPELLSDYRNAYREMKDTAARLDGLLMDEAQKAQRIDMLGFQINEIEAAELDDPDEEESLASRRKLIRNSEKILDGLSAAYNAIRGGSESEGISSLFGALTDGVEIAARYIESLEPLSQRLREIGYELQEAEGDIGTALDEFEFDQSELDLIESRLDVIYKLKRKYGADIPEILAFYENARAELEAITMSEQMAEELRKKMEEAKSAAEKLAERLSSQRAEAAERFISQVEAELAFLDMPSVKLSVASKRGELSPSGTDDMEFMAVTNIGEQPRPLGKIASGGEISRMMLAIKNVLADRDDIGTLIFDEVDSGVSGRAAQKIGDKLRQVSKDRQVICVTHLAQVAAYADTHLYIYKESDGERTYTKVEPLEGEGVFRELARITSGDLVSEAAIENARQLHAHART